MKNITHEKGCVSGIYRITNTVTGDFYIGSSLKVYYRLRRHLSELRKKGHANPILSNAFNKYGEDAFVADVLEETNDLLSREEHWIKTLKPKYNCMTMHIQRPVISDAMKKKVSASLKKAYQEGRLNCNRKPVDVFDSTGKKIGTYPSSREAAKALGIHYDSVSRVLRFKHAQVKGYRFLLSEWGETSLKPLKKSKNGEGNFKQIQCVDTETGVTYIFCSLNRAKERFGVSITQNLKTGTLYKKRYAFTYAT